MSLGWLVASPLDNTTRAVSAGTLTKRRRLHDEVAEELLKTGKN